MLVFRRSLFLFVQPGTSVVENSAVQFCARKVSAVAGDMRKALDVCRRAVELAESETRSQTVLRISGEYPVLLLIVMIIDLKGTIQDVLLSPHCIANCPTCSLQWPGRNCVQITGNT